MKGDSYEIFRSKNIYEYAKIEYDDKLKRS